MTIRLRHLLAATALTLGSISVAQGVEVRIDGTVNNFSLSNGRFASLGPIVMGTPFTAYYTIDPVADTNTGSTIGVYPLVISAARLVINGNTLDVPVANNFSSNLFVSTTPLDVHYNYDALGCVTSNTNCYDFSLAPTLMAVNSPGPITDAYLAYPFDLARFNSPMFITFDGYPDINRTATGHDFLNGRISSIAAVPLPAAAWLLVSGVGGMLGFSRRRRRIVR
jgi:hypothetical protein